MLRERLRKEGKQEGLKEGRKHEKQRARIEEIEENYDRYKGKSESTKTQENHTVDCLVDKLK